MSATRPDNQIPLMRTPRFVNLDITNNCNLRCTYCSHFAGPRSADDDLPTIEWLEFFGELKRCTVLGVTIGGGEPFCRRDMLELVEGIVQANMRFSILSNGALISDEIAAFLRSTGRCNGIQISIDGASAATHDANRGEGAFKKAIRGIETLRRHDVPIDVRVTVHKQNIGEIQAIATFLLETLALPRFSVNAVSHLGRCKLNASDLELSVEDRTRVMKTLLQLEQVYEGRIVASAGPLAEARQWLEMEEARCNGAERTEGLGHLTGCGCVWSELAVRADGIIVPCNLLGHNELGRINRDSLADVWQHHPELRRLRDRRAIPLSDFDFCAGCHYVDHCTGNCPATAHTLVGIDAHPSPDACYRRFLEAGGRIPDLQVKQSKGRLEPSS